MLDALLAFLLGIALFWKIVMVVVVAIWLLYIAYESNDNNQPRFAGKFFSLVVVYLLALGFGLVHFTPVQFLIFFGIYLVIGIVLATINWKTTYVPKFMQSKLNYFNDIKNQYNSYLDHIKVHNQKAEASAKLTPVGEGKLNIIIPKDFDVWFTTEAYRGSFTFYISGDRCNIEPSELKDRYLKVSDIRGILTEDSLFWIFDAIYHFSNVIKSLVTGAVELISPFLEGYSKKANFEFQTKFQDTVKDSQDSIAYEEMNKTTLK